MTTVKLEINNNVVETQDNKTEVDNDEFDVDVGEIEISNDEFAGGNPVNNNIRNEFTHTCSCVYTGVYMYMRERKIERKQFYVIAEISVCIYSIK